MQEQQNTQQHQLTLFLIVQYHPSRQISAATFNDTTRKLQLGAFQDNQHYTNLEALLVQLNPRQKGYNFKVHIILPQIKSQRQKILDKVSDVQVEIVTMKIPSGNIMSALQFLLNKELKFYIKELENKKGLSALQCLLNVLNLQRQNTNKGKMNLQILNLGNYMKLDKPVINALQIFPKQIQKRVISSNATLFQLLNKCKTIIGTRCLTRWMKQPQQDVEKLERRLDFIQYFINNSQVKVLFQNQLRKIPDLDALYFVFYRVAAGKKYKCEVSDLIKLYRLVKGMEGLLENLCAMNLTDKITQQIYQQISKNTNIVNRVCDMIEKNIVMEGRQSQFYVRPTAQASLTAIAKQRKKVQDEIEEQIQQIRSNLNTQLQKSPSTVYKYVLEAPKKIIDKIKQKPNYKFLTAKQTKLTFTTDQLMKLMEQLNIIQQQYKKEQMEILKKMFNIIAGYYPVMEQLSFILSELDVFTAIATLVSTSQTNWTRPIYTPTQIKGVNMHHPCIKNCIPNDCRMREKKTIILTGPNMGGKSTFIRMVGVCAYLAHIGSYVPAFHFQTPILDAIITRVGASDMQIKGISTFMSQMIESSCMLKTSTSRSLVLIDELGRGTSTSEGFGLAWGICEYLHKYIKPYCLFATHFHEMTSMQDQVQGVANMFTSCKIGAQNIQLQYKVLDGKMQKSYGIEVMKMLKFPTRVVKQAQQYLSLYEGQIIIQQNPQLNEKIKNIPNQTRRKAIGFYQQMKARISNMSKQQIYASKQKEITNQYRDKIGDLLRQYI